MVTAAVIVVGFSFSVILHLYATREDIKIWAKTISAHAKRCSRMEVSVAEGRRVGLGGYEPTPRVTRGKERYLSTHAHSGAII